MNGYEFTRYNADYTSKLKAQAYDTRAVALQAMRSYDRDGKDYREDPDYKDATDWFLETTESCNKEEATGWMKYYMANAIAYGIATKNPDWKTKYLAAYDLHNSLTRREEVKE